MMISSAFDAMAIYLDALLIILLVTLVLSSRELSSLRPAHLAERFRGRLSTAAWQQGWATTNPCDPLPRRQGSAICLAYC